MALIYWLPSSRFRIVPLSYRSGSGRSHDLTAALARGVNLFGVSRKMHPSDNVFEETSGKQRRSPVNSELSSGYNWARLPQAIVLSNEGATF